MSHLLQMRGLKPLKLSNDYTSFYVASFTDAWIETGNEYKQNQYRRRRIFYRCVD